MPEIPPQNGSDSWGSLTISASATGPESGMPRTFLPPDEVSIFSRWAMRPVACGPAPIAYRVGRLRSDR